MNNDSWMKEKSKMQQNIKVTGSQEVTIIQAGGDVYYRGAKELEVKGLLPKELESKLKDGDERDFYFLSIDVVGHSGLSSEFSPESINSTLMNLRHWLNPIITKKKGGKLSWAGDGGIFYFLQEKATDKAVDNAVSSSMDILNGLSDFNSSSHNKLYIEGKRTNIRLRLGIDFGRAIYRAEPGNWHSQALNTATKIQGMAPQPNSALITSNVYRNLTDDLRTRLKEYFHFRKSSIKFKGQPLYIFSLERIIDPLYEEYFISISKVRQREFEHLGYWVDLYAIETKLASLEEKDRGKTVKATELIDECVESGRNALVFGQSGSGKTFTSLKLFESLKEKYYFPEEALNERIPLFVELSQIRNRNNDLKGIIRGGYR